MDFFSCTTYMCRSPLHASNMSPSTTKAAGSIESGTLQRRVTTTTTGLGTSPYRPSPKLSVPGEQWNSPKPSFPLTVEVEEEYVPPTPECVPCAQSKGGRQLSVFEEESEPESVTDGPRGGSLSSPYNSPRMSRRLMNARSSPSLVVSGSKSDASDDEDDEDDAGIVELLTTSNRFPSSKGNSLPRISPNNSPLLTSRKSPTHCWTGSSDEELSSVFEPSHKHRKRLQGKKKLAARLTRGSSVCSVDSSQSRRVAAARDNLLKLRHYSSLPSSTNNGSLAGRVESATTEEESETRGTAAGYSSDVATSSNLRSSPLSRFDLSDDDGEKSCDGGMELDYADNVHRTQSAT